MERLLVGICVVMVLLGICVSVDYADTITSKNTTVEMPNDTIVVDNVNDEVITKHDGKIHTDKTVNDKPKPKKKPKVKKKVSTITMTGKPSCGCRHGYYWHTKTYVNYCPNCHRYGVLGNKHKYGARYEQEITCFACDSDFCVACGKEKYSWSKVYLRKE